MEAAKIQQKLPSAALEKLLEPIIQNEIASIRSVLSALKQEAEASEFSAGLSQYLEPAQEMAFAKVRGFITETLMRSAPNGFSLKLPSRTGATFPDEMIREMVETSSHELARIGAIA